MIRRFIAISVLAALPFTSQAQFGGPTHEFRVVTVAEGFVNPWSIAWLPGGDMLVTERGGTIRVVRDGNVSLPVDNVPAVRASQQGGLFDIVPHPDYDDNGWLYISFAKPDADNNESATTVIRARLENHALVDIEEIFEAKAWSNSGAHFGGRIVFDGRGHVFISSGERGAPTGGDPYQHPAQQTDNHFGVIVRLNEDGSVPADNPFVGVDGFEPEIWSYGHRNPQGLVWDAETGRLWETEHAPQGGDELNLILPGRNYGWPVIGYGANYGSGTELHASRYHDGMEQPKAFWVPSIAPSGLAIYHGDEFPNWEGSLFAGGLSQDHGRVSRLTVGGSDDDAVISGRYPILMQEYRVRDVRQGPDGYIYIATDSRGTDRTSIIRLERAD